MDIQESQKVLYFIVNQGTKVFETGRVKFIEDIDISSESQKHRLFFPYEQNVIILVDLTQQVRVKWLGL